MSETPPRRTGPYVVIVAVILLIPLVYNLTSPLFAQDEFNREGLFLEMPDPKHKSCVRDTTYMRLHHWELLTEIREDVVRQGVRGDVGLNKCRECHTSRERFCDRCHDAVNVKLMCFGCHYYQ